MKFTGDQHRGNRKMQVMREGQVMGKQRSGDLQGDRDRHRGRWGNGRKQTDVGKVRDLHQRHGEQQGGSGEWAEKGTSGGKAGELPDHRPQ